MGPAAAHAGRACAAVRNAAWPRHIYGCLRGLAGLEQRAASVAAAFWLAAAVNAVGACWLPTRPSIYPAAPVCPCPWRCSKTTMCT